MLAVFAMAGGPSAWAEPVSLRWSEAEQISSSLKAEIAARLPSETVPETRFEARRQADRAAAAARLALNARAFFDPAITSGVEAAGESRFIPFVEVAPGPRFTIGVIDLTYVDPPPRPEDRERVRESLSLEVGALALPAPILAAELDLVQAYRALGYADAHSVSLDTRGRRSAGKIDLNYTLRTGPPVRLGDVLYSGDSRTREGYLRRLIPYSAGAVYSPQALTAFSARLDETRLYTMARVTLASGPSSIDPDGTHVRDVLVVLDDLPRNRLGFGLRLQTDTGLGLTADYLRRNLTRRGDFLEARLDLAEPHQSLDLLWRQPNVTRYGRARRFGLTAENASTDAFDRRQLGLSLGYDIKSDPSFSYSYGANLDFTSERDAFTRIALAQARRDVRSISGFAVARWDRSDSLLDPTRGWRAEIEASPTSTSGDDSALYVRLTGEARAYRQISPDRGLVAAGRLRLGSTFGAGLADLPTSQRFYAGGGGSVRGFAFQEIGPQAADGSFTGGRSLIEASAELRWQGSPRLGWAVFLDAGAVSRNDFPQSDALRLGLGGGVRYMTPAGPLRLDIATPLDRRDGEDPVQIYISLGQAF